MGVKSTLNNTLLLAASLVVAVLIGEAGLWVLKEPALFRYYTRALAEVEDKAFADWWIHDEDGVHFDANALTDEERASLRAISPNWTRLDTVNSAGYHDEDEFSADAATARFRLLFVGDSFTWGASAERGHSFVELVEAHLIGREPDAVIWNAGMPATGTAQAANSVRELVPLMQAHAVVLGMFENDLNDNLYPADRFVRTASGVAVAQYRWDSTRQMPIRVGVEGIRAALERQIQRSELGVYKISRVAGLLRNITRSASPSVGQKQLSDRVLDSTRVYLSDIKRFCRLHQAELFVLLIPSRRTVIGRSTVEYAALEAILRSENVRFLAVRERLQAGDYASLPDNHWNDRGHRIGATAIVEALDGLDNLQPGGVIESSAR